ncbi:hypothetical protein LSAT2_030896 [Lamellibrachia satsuma]|nr:hypothetical protein LSAT2_030896 [Lamellibrachia satsuma]
MHSTSRHYPYGTDYHHMLFYTSPHHYQLSRVSPCQPPGKCNPCTASTTVKLTERNNKRTRNFNIQQAPPKTQPGQLDDLDPMTLLLDCLAVVCLTVVCLRCAVCTDNNVTLVVFDYDREPVGIVVGAKAAFGARVPRRGIQGHLMYTIPSNGCLPVRPPPRSRDWIAIMRRGSCEFSTKVLHAQLRGYVAAIVVNSHSDKLLSMGLGKSEFFSTEV